MKDWWKTVLGLGIFSALIAIVKSWGSQGEKLRDSEQALEDHKKTIQIIGQKRKEYEGLEADAVPSRLNSLR